MPAPVSIASLFSLEGRFALITGGTSGIGASIAHALAGAGARVAIVGRDRERVNAGVHRLRAEAGMQAAPIEGFIADLARVDDTLELAAKVLAEAGAPDVVVHAAGVNPRTPVDEITPTIWEHTLDLNLRAPFLLSRALVEPMRERGHGRIITLASLQSRRAFENGLVYGASKGGIVQLTRAMAEAWSRHGITANAIAPGFFPTALTAPLFLQPERAAQMASQTMIGRNGELGDLHGVAIFLASSASAYVTAQTIFVDGGWTGR